MKKIISVIISVFLFMAPLAANSQTPAEIDFHHLFDSNMAIMFIIDSQTGDILKANKAAVDFYGYTAEQLYTMKIQQINTLSPEETEKEMQAAVSENRNYFIFRHRLANGDIRTVEVYSCPHTQEGKTVLFSIIHDITAKTRLEQRNKMMSGMFMIILLGFFVIIGLFSILLFNNNKKLKIKNLEIKNFSELQKAFINADNSLIYLKDENLKYIFVNNAAEAFYKKEASEIVGHDDFDLTEEEFANMRRKTDLDVMDKKTVIVDKVKWQNRTFQTTKFPVKLINGRYGVGAYVRDVTEEHNNKIELENLNKQLLEKQYFLEEQNSLIEELNAQLEDENKRYRQQKEILQAIIDSLGAGIIMVDLQGRIVFINKAWKQLFDYLDSNQYCNSCDNFYINDDTCGSIEIFIRNMLTGIKNSQETASRLLSLTGDCETRYAVDLEQESPVKRFLNLYSNPCISNENHCFGRIFVVRDVSHQKEVDRLKMELISTVSHELRTPMSSILGFSELLLTRNLSEERNKEYIEIINSEARRLTNLINDFLDIQRMESGKQVFNKRYNSMEQIIEDALKLFENIDDRHSIVYCKNNGDIPPTYCDRDKMLQVLSNLLSNAIKFSPEGGEIKICLAVDDNEITVSVTDHGLGIPDNVKDKLFTKFYRVDNDDRRKIGGTGLGLAICKEIIQAHRGKIDVDTKYGEGSTFYFSLPFMHPDACDEPAENGSNASMGEENSLAAEGDTQPVIRGNSSIADAILEMLNSRGISVKQIEYSENTLTITFV